MKYVITAGKRQNEGVIRKLTESMTASVDAIKELATIELPVWVAIEQRGVNSQNFIGVYSDYDEAVREIEAQAGLRTRNWRNAERVNNSIADASNIVAKFNNGVCYHWFVTCRYIKL